MANTKTHNTGMAIDTHNIVSAQELQNILNKQMDAIGKNPSLSKVLPSLLIHGSPGLGKSTIVREVCEARGIGFVDVRLAELDSVDLRGVPSVDKEKGVMNWNPPDFWPRDPDSKGILFFDELTAAPKDCQVASYEIILDRKIGEIYKVPDGWYIVAAGNNATDRAVATTMSSALANRFMHVEIKENAEDWVRWATKNEIHPSVVGFINYRPNQLFNMENENLERGWPSPRSWERVSHMVDVWQDSDDHALRKIVYGLVGNRAGVEFMEFHKINCEFDSVLDMMLGKRKIVIPDQLDRKWALCSAMTYLVWKGKDEKDEELRIDGFFKLCMELSSDFATMAMVSAMAGNKTLDGTAAAKRLFNNKSYKDFAAKHGKALRQRFQF